MKIKIPFFFCAMLCFIKAYPNYPFQLKGSGFQAFNNQMIYLNFTEIRDGAYVRHNDSVIVRNGTFAFIGLLNDPACEAELSIKKAKQSYFFVLDSGQLQVQPKTNIKLAQLVIPDSKTNSLRNAINRMHSQNILNGKPTNGRSIRDIRLIELDMIQKELENFFSLIALTKLERLYQSVYPEEIAQTYYLLDEQLRKSEVGIRLEERINKATALHPGKSFPNFAFMDLKGQMQSADTLKNKPYLIAFGATWCGPCQRGIPELVALQKNMDNSKFQIVYINMDNIQANWLRMIEKQGMQAFINLTDTVPSASYSTMQESFSIKGIPFYLMIDQHKTIRFNSYLVKDEDHTIRNKVIKETVEAFEK